MEQNPVFASCTRRFCAGVIDEVIGMVPYICMLAFWRTTNFDVHFFMHGAFWVFVILCDCFFLTSRWQGTPGQKIVGIYVADACNRKISFQRALWRDVLSLLPGLPPLILNFSHWSFTNSQKMHQASLNPDLFKEYLSHAENVWPIVAGLGAMLLNIILVTLFFWLPIVFTRQKTGLHDWGSGTRVYKSPSLSAAKTLG